MSRKAEDIISDGLGTRWPAIGDEPSARLQGRVTVSEMEQIKSLAEAEGITVSEWLRRTVREKLGKEQGNPS